MRPLCRFFLGRQLKHQVDRNSRKVSLDLFVKSFGRQSVESSKVAIQKIVLRVAYWAREPVSPCNTMHEKLLSDPIANAVGWRVRSILNLAE